MKKGGLVNEDLRTTRLKAFIEHLETMTYEKFIEKEVEKHYLDFADIEDPDEVRSSLGVHTFGDYSQYGTGINRYTAAEYIFRDHCGVDLTYNKTFRTLKPSKEIVIDALKTALYVLLEKQQPFFKRNCVRLLCVIDNILDAVLRRKNESSNHTS